MRKWLVGNRLLAVAIVREGPRLAHQPVDDVPVIHTMLLPPAQARHLGHLLLRRTTPPHGP